MLIYIFEKDSHIYNIIMKISQALSKFILKIAGWKVFVSVPHIEKSVICVAPHTSNWDFILGKLCYSSVGMTANFMIKKEWFRFPFNLIFGPMGGIPVERSRNNNLIDQIVGRFNTMKTFNIAITPEGTRKRNDKWKKGFYYIALKANVPIQLAYMDYKDKVLSIEKIFVPTGNEKEDFKVINDYYKNVNAKHPDRFALNNID